MTMHNKEYIGRIMNEYQELPNEDRCDMKLANSIHSLLDKGDYSNGVIMDTLKVLVLILCKDCTDYCNEKDYEEIQESMK